jgi:hypothetical protein
VTKVISELAADAAGAMSMRVWEVPDTFELVPGPDWVEQAAPMGAAPVGAPAGPAPMLRAPWAR